MESLDEVFELLSRERRRYALYYLDERDGPVPVTELAETIEEWEGESGSSTLPDDRYRDIVLTLKHNHLPSVAEAEFVEYDRGANVVEITGSPVEFQVILSVVEAIEQPRDDDIVDIS